MSGGLIRIELELDAHDVERLRQLEREITRQIDRNERELARLCAKLRAVGWRGTLPLQGVDHDETAAHELRHLLRTVLEQVPGEATVGGEGDDAQRMD